MNIAAGLVTTGVAVVAANEVAKMFGAPTQSVLPYIAINSTTNKAILTVSAVGLLFAGVKAIKGCSRD